MNCFSSRFRKQRRDFETVSWPDVEDEAASIGRIVVHRGPSDAVAMEFGNGERSVIDQPVPAFAFALPHRAYRASPPRVLTDLHLAQFVTARPQQKRFATRHADLYRDVHNGNK